MSEHAVDDGPKVRIGVFGTSWWADAMYLPAMATHPRAELAAICGRRPGPAEEMAERWSIPAWYTDPERMLAEADLDAVVIATSNDTHHPLTMASLAAGTHVLLEKPVGLDVGEATEMAELARERGAITMVPFTYRYMPMLQWLRRLIDDGYVGTPHQVSCRYFTSFGMEGEYAWRFDKEFAGSGIIGDLGSHIVHLARWLIDDVEEQVSAVSTRFVERGPRPDGTPYEPLEDTAVLTVRYRSGAIGVLHTSANCWEGSVEFGQLQEFDIHGDRGTLHARCDWGDVQEVRGSRLGGPVPEVLPIPDELWGDLRRSPVSDTYRDVFRTTSAMTRGWIDAVADGQPIQPDLDEGLAVQRVLDAAVASAAAGGSPITIGVVE
ncbi:MAG: Gfo/Idh/MocA family oxidoreductase [Actinomycetota bacterium]